MKKYLRYTTAKEEYKRADMKDYDIVLGARSDNRYTAIDYMNAIIGDFIEFHGDRYFGDDGAVIAGIGMIKDMPVTVIGIEKGKK